MAQPDIIKSRFRSRSEHTLDPKGRLNVPSRFREVLRHYGSGILMVTPWLGECLRAFPVSEWQLLEDKLLASREDPNIGSIVRNIVSGVVECSLDKQGRLLLPVSLRTEVNIDKEVVLSGMLDFIEIWDKAAWQAEYDRTLEDPAAYRDSLAKLGIL